MAGQGRVSEAVGGTVTLWWASKWGTLVKSWLQRPQTCTPAPVVAAGSGSHLQKEVSEDELWSPSIDVRGWLQHWREEWEWSY